VRAYLAIPWVSANDNVKHTKSSNRYDNKINKNETNVKYIRIHVYEYTEWMFASNLSHRERKPKCISKFWTKHGGDGKRWPLNPSPFLAPWPSQPPAIETPPRPVPAGPLFSWPKNASCSRNPPWASHASLLPRRWAMTRHLLSLRPCTAPLSCSLQRLLKLSLVSLRPSLLQFVWTVSPYSPCLRLGLSTYVCIYICVCMYIYVYTYIEDYVYIYVYKHTSTYAHVGTGLYRHFDTCFYETETYNNGYCCQQTWRMQKIGHEMCQRIQLYIWLSHTRKDERVPNAITTLFLQEW